MRYSIIVGYRNRDLARVKKSLESLKQQNYAGVFELIFVDYGSDAGYSKEVSQLIDEYPFANYYYCATDGMLWNRGHALNVGIQKASGSVCVLYDIDLVVESNFLEKLMDIDYEKEFSIHDCYYLPEPADKIPVDLHHSDIDYPISYVGLCTVSRSTLLEIKGYDEYYQVWGAEDTGLYQKLEQAGLRRRSVSPDEMALFHQWHPTHAREYPDFWYLKMLERLAGAFSHGKGTFGALLSVEDRPVYEFISHKSKTDIQIIIPPKGGLMIFNEFILAFEKMNKGESMSVSFQYPQTAFNATSQRIIITMNRLLKSAKLNIRLINQKQAEKEALLDHVRSFIHYFLGISRDRLMDYHLNWKDDAFNLVIVAA